MTTLKNFNELHIFARSFESQRFELLHKIVYCNYSRVTVGLPSFAQLRTILPTIKFSVI